MARLPNFLVIIRSEKLSGKGQGRGVGVRKKERFVLGKRTFRSQKSKHFVLRIIDTFYRFYTYHDLHLLCCRLKDIYDTYDCMEDAMAAAGPCEDPILRLRQLFADLNGIPVLHGTSACKRLAMFLRWMVRTDGIVDLGIWRTAVHPRQLIIPLDTHVHQISLRLGLTGQKTATLRTAREITDALAKVFPDDPCLGDFALFGYDINQE